MIVSAVSYVLKWFQPQESLIKDSQFVDLSKKEECNFYMICTYTFNGRYPNLFPFTDKELDKVCEKFLDYQAMLPFPEWCPCFCDFITS